MIKQKYQVAKCLSRYPLSDPKPPSTVKKLSTLNRLPTRRLKRIFPSESLAMLISNGNRGLETYSYDAVVLDSNLISHHRTLT